MVLIKDTKNHAVLSLHGFPFMIMKAFQSLSLPSKLTELYLSVMFLLLPLYVHRGYFDITEAKFGCFVLLSSIFVLLMPFAEMKSSDDRWLSLPVVFFFGFAFVSILSSLHYIGRASLFAVENRYQGILVLGLYALCFLFCSRRAVFGVWVRVTAFTAFGLVSLIALLQSFGIDPLGLWEGIRDSDRGRYLSTIGNVNFLGAYNSLLLPLCGGCICQNRKGYYWLLPVFALGCCGLLCGSDAGLLGVGGGMLLLWLLGGRDHEYRHRFGLLLLTSALSFFLYTNVLRLCGVLTLSPAGKVVASLPVCLFLCAVGAALWFFTGEIGSVLLLAPLCFPLAALCVAFVGNLKPEVLPKAWRTYLVFSSSWGSDRGAIWLHCLDQFRQHSPLQKLIGGGSGCLARYDRLHRLFPDAIVDSAHNEYLHLLLTSGVAGLTAYVCSIVSALLRGAKKQPAVAAAVFGCALQACVNIAQCATTPLLLLLAAVLCA